MKIKTLLLSASLLACWSQTHAADVQASAVSQAKPSVVRSTLTKQQQALIPISAFAAVGDLPKLNQALNTGLDQGLTINQIKSVLVQIYAYAGFPRSLNALTEFMHVVEQRKAKGIHDVEGPDFKVQTNGNQAIVQGTQTQTALVGQPVKGPLFDFSPEIAQYLQAHLFGDIFSNDVLNWQDREIATVSMLAAMTGTDGQLKSHVQMSLNIKISQAQLKQLQAILTEQVSANAGQRLAALLR